MRDTAAVIGFKGGQARSEQFVAWYEDDVEAWRDVITTENLSNQSLRPISYHCAAQAFRSGDAKSADREAVGLGEQRVIPARNPPAIGVDVLELCVPANTLNGTKLQQPLFTTNS